MLKHNVHELTLPNGLKGLIIDTPKTGVVVAEVSFRAGEFMLERKKWETAHLMEHVLLGANHDFPKARDFQAAIEQNGAYSNASTSVYDITYEVEAADFEWQRVVGLLLDAISTPKFLQEEVDSELSNVREELISRGNNHFRHLNLALRAEMGLASLTDQERVELMDNVKRSDLLKHYKATHTLSNARFIIAGNFRGEHSEIIKMLKKRLKLDKGTGRVAMPDESTRTLSSPLVLRKPSVPNIYLYLDMYLGRDFSPKEKIALQVLGMMLTETMYSRIFGAAREKGWVYAMGSGATYAKNVSGWWMGAQVTKTNSEPLLRLIRDELTLLRSGQIDKEDFESARKHLLGKTMRSGQTASGIVGHYGSYYVQGDVDNLNRLPALIRRVTADQCIRLMQEMINEGTWGIGVLGNVTQKPAEKLHGYMVQVFET